MSDLQIELIELVEQGNLSFEQIASKLNVPIEWVLFIANQVLED